MNTMPSVVQVFDTNDVKLYEGDSRDCAKEYGCRLLMLGTQDQLHFLETGPGGLQRFVLTREQALQWYDRKHATGLAKRLPSEPLPRNIPVMTFQHKVRARRFANSISAMIFFIILVATLQAMHSIIR